MYSRPCGSLARLSEEVPNWQISWNTACIVGFPLSPYGCKRRQSKRIVCNNHLWKLWHWPRKRYHSVCFSNRHYEFVHGTLTASVLAFTHFLKSSGLSCNAWCWRHRRCSWTMSHQLLDARAYRHVSSILLIFPDHDHFHPRNTIIEWPSGYFWVNITCEVLDAVLDLGTMYFHNTFCPCNC